MTGTGSVLAGEREKMAAKPQNEAVICNVK